MATRMVLVIGSGTMGSGIAQVCAQAGISVFLYDVDGANLEKAFKNIEWSVGKLAEKGKLEEDKDVVMGRIQTCRDMQAAAAVDLVIEAVFENMDLKKSVFSQADRLCHAEAVIASNTSAIPITELAAATQRPEKVIGLHFFNPVPLMQVVEVVRGAVTTDATMDRGKAFVMQIKKEPIMVNRDVAGFVINRINYPASIEAMRLVEQGVASVEDIDKGLRLGAGRKMGIFEIGDMVGLDVTYGGLMAMYNETGDPRWFPPLLLRRKVKAGHLGRKAGKGWYEYNPDGSRR
ncbi:MAG TPA: 3-hydroxyacyl-CoA dehydrogenase family protein [Desulfobacterales bacterium]|nr:3-hydroxyacyl-CoA dehydrogenase family protein [Desulfobacterales bacterium]